MNYLAHIFLSGNNAELQIGNFIGDFVKGSRMNNYPQNIRKGIILHRKIDEFTDAHPVVRDTVELIKPEFGRYSAIVADMYFDYFLATNFKMYAYHSIHFFSLRFYFSVLKNYRYLPVRVKRFIFHFIGTHRLYKYSSISGLKNSLQIMKNHKTNAIQPEKAIEFLIENTDILEKKFHLFFPDLIGFVKQNNLDNKLYPKNHILKNAKAQ